MGRSVNKSPSPAPTTNADATRDRSVKGRPFPIGPMVAGVSVIAIFFGCLTLWSALAPIEGAIISPGVVSVSSYRKTIQHLEGGIVDEILVEDGDHVEPGQVLIELRDIRVRAETRQLRGQYAEAQAKVARLLAERDGASTIAIPETLANLEDVEGEIDSAISGQQSIFRSRREHLDNRKSVLEQKIAQSQAVIEGLKGQMTSVEQRRALTETELKEIAPLVKKSLVPAPRLRELEGRVAEFDGLLSEHRGDIAREEKEILEAHQQIVELDTSTNTEITEQLRVERAHAYEISQKIVAAEDVLTRSKIRSPIEGVVVNLQVHTQDGVIAAGQPLMEIVPVDDELVVEAFINPEDINEVRTGLPANVQLTSQNRRHRELIEGKVTSISADRLIDGQTGAPYYRARVQLDPTSRDAFGDTLLAGMGADVFIRTGARTPFDYLLQPIARGIQHGLREN